MKFLRPVYLHPSGRNADAVHYLYSLSNPPPDLAHHVDVLRSVARSITHLGWGIDMVAGNAELLTAEQAENLAGDRWRPDAAGVGTPLRVPIRGTLDALVHRHERFLNRLSSDGFRPVPPLTRFDIVHFRRAGDPVQRPFRMFRLANPDEGISGERPFSYPQDKLVHIAGMVRHLAVAAMKLDQPPDTPQEWIETYVAGHAQPGIAEHRRFSYVPLPSIGHPHTDPAIRRVLIAAPPGDDRWLDFLTARLSSRQLQPENGTRLDKPPILQRDRSSGVIRRYTDKSSTWASVTPVILPGHDDHNPSKTEKLIRKALAQSGIEQPCEFEWRAVSWFPKSYSAHKYDRSKRPVGYIRPDHLLNYTAVHMRIEFANGLRFPGPLIIGAGRHCGFGLFATLPDSRKTTDPTSPTDL